MGNDRLPRLFLAAAAGALAGLSLPPLGWPWLLWPCLAVLWALAGAERGGMAALLWGGGAVLVSHRWLLALHPLDWIGVPSPLSLPICLLLWGGCALLGGLLVGGWAVLVRRLEPGRLSTAFLAAGVWGLGEVLLAKGPLFWIGLGASPLPGDPWLAGLAVWVGAGGVAALQVLLGWGFWRWARAWHWSGRTGTETGIGIGSAGSGSGSGIRLASAGGGGNGTAAGGGDPGDAPAAAMGRGPAAKGAAGGIGGASGGSLERSSWRQPTGRGLWRWGGGLAVGLLVCHLLGAAALAPRAQATATTAETVLVVQPAIPTRQKFLPGQQERLANLLAGALAKAEPSGATVVLPEGALALDQHLPGPSSVEVLSGGFRRADTSLRSALLRFAPHSMVAGSWVDKHRVVPLGEWVPLAPLLRWSGLSAVGGIEAGDASRVLRRPAGPIGVAICYEIADGRSLAGASRAGARWLLASANLDPYPRALQSQFQALARLRALESGRWLVSAANTGPSVLVNPAGRVMDSLPSGRTSTGFFTVPSRSGLTPYLLVGERSLLVLIIMGLALRVAQR
jgi:apolipoprotein N-acyltransferase